MVISHKYKYIYIQLEKTASTAMANELCKNYDGQRIMWKHARYEDFLSIANENEKKYFAFGGIRNPLDVAVSRYHLRSQGQQNEDKNNLRQHNFIKHHKADFSMFLKKFYGHNIFSDFKNNGYNKLDYIYKYENIQKDFSNILRKLNIKQIRPLPLQNQTENKNKDYLKYYNKNIQPLAYIVFKDYMNKWQYNFPSNWYKSQSIQYLLKEKYLKTKNNLKQPIMRCLRHPSIYKHLFK